MRELNNLISLNFWFSLSNYSKRNFILPGELCKQYSLIKMLPEQLMWVYFSMVMQMEAIGNVWWKLKKKDWESFMWSLNSGLCWYCFWGLCIAHNGYSVNFYLMSKTYFLNDALYKIILCLVKQQNLKIQISRKRLFNF